MSRLLAAPMTPPVRHKSQQLSSHSVQNLVWVWLLVTACSSPIIGPNTAPAVSPVARGIITLTSNLRDAPSMKSEVVGVAKERMTVEILAQTEHWYHIRTSDGIEAWIYKPLVLVEPATALQTGTTAVSPPEVSPPTIAEEPQDTPTPMPEPVVVPEPPQPEAAPEQAGQQQPVDTGTWLAGQSAPADPVRVPAELITAPAEPVTIPARPIGLSGGPNLGPAIVHAPLQGLMGYLLAALVVMGIVSIWLQWRAGRQLRRAMGEMGQVLDLVEDIYSEMALSRPNAPQDSPSLPTPAAIPTLPATAPTTVALPIPTLELSPLERALLEGLSSGEEIPEGELAKVLQERGFPGVLIKAVIGDIVRKTADDGRPWVAVTYTQGRYAYALRLPNGANGREAHQGE